MNRDSNWYTFILASVMFIAVSSSLALTHSSLKEKQKDNVRNEKMQNILATIGIYTSRESAEEIYTKHIVEELSLKIDGTNDQSVSTFNISLNKELKKPDSEQRYPLYVASVDKDKFYIVPLRGAGLWDAIWGYIALENDFKTIKGVVFDHKSETAGLGAEITQDWFQDSFKGEKILDQKNNLVGIDVSKTNNDPKGLDKEDNQVDYISGATITGDGVSDMISERLEKYTSYFDKMKKI